LLIAFGNFISFNVIFDFNAIFVKFHWDIYSTVGLQMNRRCPVTSSAVSWLAHFTTHFTGSDRAIGPQCAVFVSPVNYFW